MKLVSEEGFPAAPPPAVWVTVKGQAMERALDIQGDSVSIEGFSLPENSEPDQGVVMKVFVSADPRLLPPEAFLFSKVAIAAELAAKDVLSGSMVAVPITAEAVISEDMVVDGKIALMMPIVSASVPLVGFRPGAKINTILYRDPLVDTFPGSIVVESVVFMVKVDQYGIETP